MDFNRDLFQSTLLQGLKDWDLGALRPGIPAITRYVELVLKTNQTLNLTRIVEPEEMAIKNVLDSLALLRLDWPAKLSCVDLGTGAGFPGVPLALCRPDWSIVLLDSLLKRLRFLDQAAETIGLTNVVTLHARAEEAGQAKEHREKYDLVVSRAVASLPVLLELASPLVKVGGVFVAYKSGDALAELEQSSKALRELRMQTERVFPTELPLSMGDRNLLLFRKKAATPPLFPRRPGLPSKQPLK
ncbi:MAG TPA: 16S rRNA (guanine(527)-N(7))-methyltransferase RsmG [Firmicutes bacterium]|nr:16S rRNA (guanine(527)-N(7))-methyltransferase RsmG [Bacillota bacterium]